MKYKIAELCEINRKNISKKDDIEYINYLDTSNLTEGVIKDLKQYNLKNDKVPSRAKRLVRENDILISTVRPNQKHYGILREIPENLVVSTGFAVLTPDQKKVYPEYLYRFLTQNHITEYLQSIAETSTSAYPSIKPSVIGELEIDLPPLAEQKSIADIFLSIDQKITINNKINNILEKIAMAIYKHWFIDFEFPNENGEPYKSSGGEMVENKLGLIPKGWKIKSLDEIADFLNGLAMQKYRPQNGEKGIPVLKIRELRQGRIDNNSDICSENINADYVVEDGDIIFSWSGSLLVDIWCGGKVGLNQHLFKVTSKDYEKWFYYYWTKYHLDRFIHIAEAKATTMGHIRRKDLSDSKVLIPTQNVYEKANNILKPIIELIINLKIQSRRLENIRNILLPKLISGEIRVPVENE